MRHVRAAFWTAVGVALAADFAQVIVALAAWEWLR